MICSEAPPDVSEEPAVSKGPAVSEGPSVTEREINLLQREQNFNAREQKFREREVNLTLREEAIRLREEKIAVREDNVKLRESQARVSAPQPTPPPDYSLVRVDTVTGKVIEIGSTEYCPANMRFFAIPGSKTEGTCDCDYHQCARPLLYSSKYNQCFWAWSQVSFSNCDVVWKRI